MSNATFFPARPEVRPSIYAYRDKNPDHANFLKVGYTEIDVEKRVAQQFPVIQPGEGKPYEIVFAESAMRTDGSSFMDHAVHKRLAANGFANVGGEWFRCTPADVRNAWLQVRDRNSYERERTEDFAMRPEQLEAVNKTEAYFRACEQPGNRNAPKFLWNAKMRFGKTFATYQLARRMNMKRVLVLTFKPAVEDAWREDLESHIDFEGWQFVSRGAMAYEECDPACPIVCFGSFQDFLGVDRATGAIKPRNEWVHLEHWDLVAFDEYHFGAWRDSAQKLFAKPADEDDVVESTEKEVDAASTGNNIDETWLPIQADRYLYLSGTPFRALTSGEFIEDQIFNWTYSDEQQAKQEWARTHPFEPNPYAALPRMVLMTYKVPDSISRVARAGEFDEFDLNVFFSAVGEGAEAQFKYKDYVQKWLDLIRGALAETTTDELKMGAQKPVLPFSHAALLANLTHTLWFLPNVASCHAMANLLAERQNIFYHDYQVLVAAGSDAGIGLEAVEPVRRAMGDPLATKTITLSCGKLTTGVTIRPWTGVFMLRNLKSPETYFQTAFRVQSPWTAKDEDGHMQVIKQECYVFDFALDRALAMVSDYSCQLSVDEPNPEKKVADFIKFLPVLAYDGSAMREVNAADILDIAMAGTSATLLARRWESALLVNVDNDTLRRLLENDEAMRALSNIEGFRSLNDDIETIINKSEHVKKVKKEDGGAQQEREEGTLRRGKGIQEQTQADPRETDQVRHAHPRVHVSHRLSRAEPQRSHHAAGTRPVQEGHRPVGTRFRASSVARRVPRFRDERRGVQVPSLRGRESFLHRHREAQLRCACGPVRHLAVHGGFRGDGTAGHAAGRDRAPGAADQGRRGSGYGRAARWAPADRRGGVRAAAHRGRTRANAARARARRGRPSSRCDRCGAGYGDAAEPCFGVRRHASC